MPAVHVYIVGYTILTRVDIWVIFLYQISVLHGPPGTGKTLTAEGVAELLKRPLYMVGATELSLTPHEMERSLKGVLSVRVLSVSSTFTTRTYLYVGGT